MAWPTNTEAVAYLAANDIVMPDGSAITTTHVTAARVLAAISRFELMTGWLPFEAATQTRTFDPPGRSMGPYGTLGGGGQLLRLNAGLLSVTTLTFGGTTKTEGEDFWLVRSRPEMPAFAIRFRTVMLGLPQSISIAGSWGRMAAPDDLAKEAVLKLICAMALTGIRESFLQLGDLEWKEADVSERGSIENYAKVGTAFEAEAAEIAKLYTCVTVGV